MINDQYGPTQSSVEGRKSIGYGFNPTWNTGICVLHSVNIIIISAWGHGFNADSVISFGSWIQVRNLQNLEMRRERGKLKQHDLQK